MVTGWKIVRVGCTARDAGTTGLQSKIAPDADYSRLGAIEYNPKAM